MRKQPSVEKTTVGAVMASDVGLVQAPVLQALLAQSGSHPSL